MSKLKDMFKKTSYIPIGRLDEPKKEEKPSVEEDAAPCVPEGLWVKCPKCGKLLYKQDVVDNHYVCPKCGGYFRIKTKTRLRMVLDHGTFESWYNDLPQRNPLDYPGYEEKLEAQREKTHLHEAVTIGRGKIYGKDAVVGVCDARFLMSSMGYVVGEKITRAFEQAINEKLPVILFCCSGGARMQEGIVSLMQMAKTSAAIKRHSEAGLLYIPVLTDPTTGGVTASFAMLGDIILAEPGALIGFAGPRVIAQTIGQKLPEGFQRAEFLVEKGIIDGIVERSSLKLRLAMLIDMHESRNGFASFHKAAGELGTLLYGDTDSPRENTAFEEKTGSDLSDSVRGMAYDQGEGYKKSAWEKVQISRMADRPTSLDYIEAIFEHFTELHGDRNFRDDGAVVGGIAYLNGQPVTVIGQQKGKNTKDNITRNFGMVSPEGYRKALRLMKQAEKFHRPIINFVDTPGAACGIEAEERGQGEAIARNLMEMSALKTPVLSIMIGEGGSGGALGLAVANEVWMMENATYSVLSPEGFASILWKDGKRAKEASEIMKITAEDLKELGIIERIIPEREPAMMENITEIAGYMKNNICRFLEDQNQLQIGEIAERRYRRFRNM